MELIQWYLKLNNKRKCDKSISVMIELVLKEILILIVVVVMMRIIKGNDMIDVVVKEKLRLLLK